MEEKKQKCVSGMALRGYRKDKIFEAGVMPESQYSIGGIKNGISILFLL